LEATTPTHVRITIVSERTGSPAGGTPLDLAMDGSSTVTSTSNPLAANQFYLVSAQAFVDADGDSTFDEGEEAGIAPQQRIFVQPQATVSVVFYLDTARARASRSETEVNAQVGTDLGRADVTPFSGFRYTDPMEARLFADTVSDFETDPVSAGWLVEFGMGNVSNGNGGAGFEGADPTVTGDDVVTTFDMGLAGSPPMHALGCAGDSTGAGTCWVWHFNATTGESWSRQDRMLDMKDLDGVSPANSAGIDIIVTSNEVPGFETAGVWADTNQDGLIDFWRYNGSQTLSWGPPHATDTVVLGTTDYQFRYVDNIGAIIRIEFDVDTNPWTVTILDEANDPPR
jgi:hypothetical protein